MDLVRLSAILTKATGKTTRQFAQAHVDDIIEHLIVEPIAAAAKDTTAAVTHAASVYSCST